MADSNLEKHIQYWIEYDGNGDEYRKTHDLDCILAGGNLYADTLISLWLPLRYVLDKENSEKWKLFLEYEKKELRPKRKNLKYHDEFLSDLKVNIDEYIKDKAVRKRIEELFGLGRTRANVIILPYRRWNCIRGKMPYWDYMPHFLFDMLNTESPQFISTVCEWIKQEHLEMFFDGDIKKENLKDLCGTGGVCSHSPLNSGFDIMKLINNYIDILIERQEIIK